LIRHGRAGVQEFDEQSKRLLSDFKLENKLWQFIKVNCNVIFKVKNWIYRCVGEMVKEDFITEAEAAK
jgi:hypothetical protein